MSLHVFLIFHPFPKGLTQRATMKGSENCTEIPFLKISEIQRGKGK